MKWGVNQGVMLHTYARLSVVVVGIELFYILVLFRGSLLKINEVYISGVYNSISEVDEKQENNLQRRCPPPPQYGHQYLYYIPST